MMPAKPILLLLTRLLWFLVVFNSYIVNPFVKKKKKKRVFLASDPDQF